MPIAVAAIGYYNGWIGYQKQDEQIEGNYHKIYQSGMLVEDIAFVLLSLTFFESLYQLIAPDYLC